jgi:hypothetical protein
MGDTETIDARIPSPPLCLRVRDLCPWLLSRLKTIYLGASCPEFATFPS